MNFWQELIVLLSFTFAGIYAGVKISHMKGRLWFLGSAFSVMLLAMLAADRFFHFIPFVQPFTILLAGRFRFVVVAFTVTIGLTPLLSRTNIIYQKVFLTIVMIASVIWFSILPFVMPVIMKNRLLSLPMIINADGVCFQSTDYTCGPAAAVTALGKLGFYAHEGEIAYLSYTNPITGTFPSCLESAIRSQFANRGLDCHYRRFKSIDDLKDAGPTIVVVKSTFLWDHCIVVLNVDGRYVYLADPVLGKVRVTRWQLEKNLAIYGNCLESQSTKPRLKLKKFEKKFTSH